MQIFGNICLALALFIYAVPLQFVLHDNSGRRNDGSVIWAAIYFLVPLWFLLTLALCAATSRGGLDWLFRERAPQYLIVLASGVALLVVSVFSMIGKFEPPSQMPFASRFLSGWAVLMFPVVIMGFCLLALNPSLGSAVPPLAYRIPVVIVAGVSLLATVGLIGLWIFYSQQQQLARIDRAVEAGNERDRNIMTEVTAMNPTNNFIQLLGFANRFENEDIRKVAIEKAQSNPQFTAELAEVLKNYWAEKGLVYLDACDVSEADMKTLAEPVRAGMLVLAKAAREAVAETHTFYAEQFDWNTRLMLSVADKFHGSGVDYVAAIREFRAALDLPRGKDFNFNARPALDAWLARQTKTPVKKP